VSLPSFDDNIRAIFCYSACLNAWHSIEQYIINTSIDQWDAGLETCVHADSVGIAKNWGFDVFNPPSWT